MNILIKKSFANSLSVLNLMLGFIAIILISLSMIEFNYITLACQFIFFAALIDVLDGKIARKLGTSGNFGKEIDSLADLVSFCVAPSYLIFFYCYDLMNINLVLLIIISSSTLIFGAIRLAKFNAYPEQSDNSYYIGLPTPANAILICSLVLYMFNMPFNDLTELMSFFNSDIITDFFIFRWINYPLSIFLSYNEYMLVGIYLFSSILLISKIKYSKFPVFNFKVNIINTLNLIGLGIFFIILIVSIFLNKYHIVLLFFVLSYILGGIINHFYNGLASLKKKG